MRRALGEDAVRARLSEHPGWEVREGVLRREYRFDSYGAGVAFANRVAELAERADHHPDILIGYRRVVLALVTHDAGGLTERDFDLAGAIDGKEAG